MKMENSRTKTPERKLNGRRIDYICPKCGQKLEMKLRYRRNVCMNCGQAVDFEQTEKQWWAEWLVCQDREEAMRCTEKYNEITKCGFFHPESFLDHDIPENRWWPKNLCFFFTEPKDYGRFMLWVAKEGSARRSFAI